VKVSSAADRRTEYRWGYLWAGSVLAALAAAMLGLELYQLHLLPRVAGELAPLMFGWGPPLAFLRAIVEFLLQLGRKQLSHPPLQLLTSGGLLWLAGWAVIALGIRRTGPALEAVSEAKGAQLYPPLARYADFHWGTLLAYGGGILFSEIALILSQTALARVIPPVSAFAVSLLVGFAVAFAAGFVGAWRAHRLSVPEATVGILYFGFPIPLALTALSSNPSLQIQYGQRASTTLGTLFESLLGRRTLELREIVYLANLIGRPELGYWLAFLGLALMMIFGITAGFVATASGGLQLRSRFELFVARRHAAVFRPRLLLGLLLVLLLGIIPPLIIYAIVRAAEAAVERTRIRELGLVDPLKATEALDRLKTQEHSPTAMMTALSVGGVGVGVMALIIVLSVMSGFEADLQQKILGTNAHIMVTKYSDPFTEYPDVMQKIRGVKGVTAVTPIVMGEVMLTADQNTGGGVIVWGVDPATFTSVTDLKKDILGGSLDALDHPESILSRTNVHSGPDQDPIIDTSPVREGSSRALPGILLGSEMAKSLRVDVGDRVNVISPFGGELSPQGPMPKGRPFRVVGIFSTGMFEYDLKYSYIQLEEAQKFFNLKGVTGLELKVADIDDARRIAQTIVNELDGYPYRARDWGEMNRNLFSALRLEKLVMGIILTIIVIVAAGLIIATVIMLVLEKRKEISVLKALGVPDGGIVKIFLAEGLQIGVAGGLLGLFSGLAWCVLIEKVGIRLDPQVYYIQELPVRIEPLQTAISVVIAIVVTYLASVYPAFKAAQVEPVEGLKAE
jgi:lipoprotein-releasing system permease protein